ncbi:MAG: site-2 protease family protein [Chromatiales bacterium]|nr:site-2 protease family protein [Chromatiales bacterium]
MVALGILITVHEFGHYWVARRLGVKVLRFSVGFGRPLWLRRCGRDQTEWVIAAVPLGGYVKMLGEHDDEVPEAELPRAFDRQPVWQARGDRRLPARCSISCSRSSPMPVSISCRHRRHPASGRQGGGRFPGGAGRFPARRRVGQQSTTGRCATWDERPVGICTR